MNEQELKKLVELLADEFLPHGVGVYFDTDSYRQKLAKLVNQALREDDGKENSNG